MKGMLRVNETDEETGRSPMAVKRARGSGRARAIILRNEVEVGLHSRKRKTGETEKG